MSKNNKKGFTIIEVVLVLAIAGLIFLMVFIALPALQRSQRNTRRRQDMARILSAFNDYQSNNNGQMPDNTTTTSPNTKLTEFAKRYIAANATGTYPTSNTTACSAALGDQFCDPDGTSYIFSYKGAASGEQDAVDGTSALNHTIYYWQDAKCGAEGKTADGNGNREIAIFYVLEGGSIYCGDNQ